MCGISGVLGLKRELNSKDYEDGQKMIQALRHRGPDHQGIFSDQRCFIANSRLKVIDPGDRANMPMSNLDRNLWLTYNGEVTNFKELRKTLLDRGQVFNTGSDTEVLIHLYECMGIDFINKLSGMFAFCLYDQKQEKAYVVRDHYGMRPVFYFYKDNCLYFSSEIKSIISLDCFSLDLEHEAIYHYFSLGYIPGTLTPFKEVKELDGGHLLEIDFRKNTLDLREYFKIDFQTDLTMSKQQAVDGFFDVMLRSVERNMIADCPVGVTLSGGIDSSAIVGLAKVLGRSKDLHTFSLKINSPSFDESKYQNIMVRYSGSIHHEIVVNPKDILKNVYTHMAYLDEPINDGSAIPNFLLSNVAKKYVKVLLSGEGGDEISNAYETHLAYKVASLYRSVTSPSIRKIISGFCQSLPTSYRKLSLDFLAKRFSEGAQKEVPIAHYFWRHILSAKDKEFFLSHHNFKGTENLFRELYQSNNFSDELNRISLIDLKYFFIGNLMVKNDRMLMANSVEARFPYMDRDVVDFTSKMPTEYKINCFRSRYFQKIAMKNCLPKEIISRKNFGIEIPYSIWFLKEFRSLGDKYFSNKSINKVGFLNADFVNFKWQQHLNKKQDNGRFLWALLMFLIWYEIYVIERNFKKYI